MIKFALLGCGRISSRHAELLSGGQIKNAKLIAVCDKEKDKADFLSKKYNCKSYQNITEMMKENEIDIVSVLTESGNHCKHAIELSKFNVHVIVEKPMALKVSDAKKMIKIFQSKKLKLFVVKQNRFNPAVLKLKKALINKSLGKIFLGTIRVRWKRDNDYYLKDKWRGTWQLDGGVLANQAIHHIDLLEWMVGDVKSVYAKSIKALARIEAEDTAIVILKFKNGALGVIEVTTATRPIDLEGSLSILGSKGTVELGGFAVNEIKNWFVDKNKQTNKINRKKYLTLPPNVYGFGHKSFYENVIKSIKGKPNKVTFGKDGIKSLILVNAIYKSIELNREVFIGSGNHKSKLGRTK